VAYAGIASDLTGVAVAWAVVGDSDTHGNAGRILAPLEGLALSFTWWALQPDSRQMTGRRSRSPSSG